MATHFAIHCPKKIKEDIEAFRPFPVAINKYFITVAVPITHRIPRLVDTKVCTLPDNYSHVLTKINPNLIPKLAELAENYYVGIVGDC